LTTNCIFPPALDDKQLLAYLDGEADAATVTHLEDCAYCRQKVKNLDRVQKHLTNRLYRLACPPPTELGEYYLRVLPASEMLLVARHVRECPYCAQEVGELQGFLSDPATLARGRWPERARILIAQLVKGGGLTSAPAAALRGEAKGPITFVAEDIVIVLDVQLEAEQGVNILGQVAADNQAEWTGALAELWKDNMLASSSLVDDLGAFQCQGVTAGQYQLRMTSKNNSVVVIPNFEIPAK
jgi:hypothetical protein